MECLISQRDFDVIVILAVWNLVHHGAQFIGDDFQIKLGNVVR
jgi:hypothetical protein